MGTTLHIRACACVSLIVGNDIEAYEIGVKNDKTTRQRTSRGRTPKRRGYRGLTAEQLQDQREERLITAGIDLFGECGYAATSIEKLCSHAKVSTRHFYEQFDGRESILYAVHDDLSNHMEKIVHRELVDGRTPMNQRVADTIEAMVLYLLDEPKRGRVLCIESVGVSPPMEAKRRAATHRLAGVISRYASIMAKREMLPERDYHLPSIALVGMFNELIVEWLTSKTELTPNEMAREAKILFRAMAFGAQQYRDSADIPARQDSGGCLG